MLVVQNIFIYVAALVFSIDSDRSLFKKSIRTMESLLAHDIKHRGNMDKLMQPKNRSIVQVNTIQQKTECNGFLVGKVIGGDDLEYLDPFLMFDHIGPITYSPGEAIGAPDHPHRGMHIINYLLDGSIAHADTMGHSGLLYPGSVQMLACGKGLVHYEMPSDQLLSNGGNMEGFQVWINVPRTEKFKDPSYQELNPGDLPLVKTENNDAVIRVLSGEVMGVEGGLDTTDSLFFVDVILEVGSSLLNIDVPEDFDCLLAYVWRGKPTLFGKSEKHSVKNQEAIIFDTSGSQVSVQNSSNERCRMLIIGGRRLNEPLVRFGPFAMCNQEEVDEATADYQAGRMGRLDGAEARLASNEEALHRLRNSRNIDDRESRQV